MTSPRRTIMNTQNENNPIVRQKRIREEILSSEYNTASSSSSIDTQINQNEISFDIESQQGKFIWMKIYKEYLPCIFRNNERFCSITMLEVDIIKKYFSRLNPCLFEFKRIPSNRLTFNEIKLLTEINKNHCKRRYGSNYCDGDDAIIKLEDAIEFMKFLNFCKEKIDHPVITRNAPCGFIRLNRQFIISYTVKNGQKYIPLFLIPNGNYIFRNTKFLSHDDWAICYLRFCCNIQGIEDEMFENRNSTEAIDWLTLELFLSEGTSIEYLWPDNPSSYTPFLIPTFN